VRLDRRRRHSRCLSLEAAHTGQPPCHGYLHGAPANWRVALSLDVTNADLKNALAKREQLLSRCDDEMNTLVPKVADISKEHVTEIFSADHLPDSASARSRAG
jgi:hypothetical protein